MVILNKDMYAGRCRRIRSLSSVGSLRQPVQPQRVAGVCCLSECGHCLLLGASSFGCCVVVVGDGAEVV